MKKKSAHVSFTTYPEDSLWKALMSVLATEQRELADIRLRHQRRRKARRQQRKRQGR